MGISKEESEAEIVPTKEKPEPKKTEKHAAEEIEEKTPTPSSRRRTEERKGRRPEDEIHEVPIVKPLKDPDPYYGKGRGTDISWLERLEDEKEEHEETAEVAGEPIPPEDLKMSEAKKRKAEKREQARAKLIEALNAREEFYIPGGLPDKKDDKAIEK